MFRVRGTPRRGKTVLVKITESENFSTLYVCMLGIASCKNVQHPEWADPDAGLERGGGGQDPGDLQALRE